VNDTDNRYMKLALALSARGLGKTAPNPAVGCVIVQNGRIVGRGVTAIGGRPHAEIMALSQAGPAARGADVYVTLEPCCHHGHSPPCTDALVDAGVARVIVATQDPNPQVNGAGIAQLRGANVDVSVGVGDEQARRVNAGFFSVINQARPSVTLKLAASLDGRIATASGESKWITRADARRRVHAMRARHDAVMIGGGTARADDPGLTVRAMGMAPQPARVVLSRRLDLPLQSQLASTAQAVPVLIFHGQDAAPELVSAWQGLGAILHLVPTDASQRLSPKACLEILAKSGITRVLCEGGGALAASLLAADLVDELHLFTAGLAIGADGRPLLADLGVNRLGDAPNLSLQSHQSIGNDLLSIWRRPAPDVSIS